MQHRPIRTLDSQSFSSPGIRVRLLANAFIPWSWVEFPDPPTAIPGSLGRASRAIAGAVNFFVHGDGRMPVNSSDAVRNRFRILGAVEINVVEQPGETYGSLVQNQPSRSEFRTPRGSVISAQTGVGPLESKISAKRIHTNKVEVSMSVGGSVPAHVAGPQAAIDFKYDFKLEYLPARNVVQWEASAKHDGFPGHELFIESGGTTHHHYNYLPSWFSTPGTGTAHPTILQSSQGGAALAGVYNPQTSSQTGIFRP